MITHAVALDEYLIFIVLYNLPTKLFAHTICVNNPIFVHLHDRTFDIVIEEGNRT